VVKFAIFHILRKIKMASNTDTALPCIRVKVEFFLQFCGPRSHPRAPIGVKFCVANKRTHVPHGSAKFHVNRCNESPLGAKMVIFGL